MLVTMQVEEVGEVPKIISQPNSQVIEEGQTVRFECILSGKPRPEVSY